MMKTTSSLKRTKHGYTLRLTKMEFDELYAMVDEANGNFDYERSHYSDGRNKRKLRACDRVMMILNDQIVW